MNALLNRNNDTNQMGNVKWKHLYQRFTGGTIEYDLGYYKKLLKRIRSESLEHETDGSLKQKARELSVQARAGVDMENLLVPAFALVAEAFRRRLGMEPFDVQIMAGIAMHEGKLVEMQTGEGKTLAAVFPAVLNALTRQGVHILTANDYLAKRDAEWMGPVYEFLGLQAAFVREGMTKHQRKNAYQSDITYLTAKEAGFDFLRDHTRRSVSELVLRPFHFVIVDEADFLLIDEARVPLVIAGSDDRHPIDYHDLANHIRELEPGVHFETDEYARNASLTEEGFNAIEKKLGLGSLQDPSNLMLLAAVNVALHARVLLRRDLDYIARDGKIELVDEFTGRVADNRRWPHGIQPAVEAWEGLEVQPEGKVMSSISMQNFLKLYPRISGMTATAVPAAEEFFTFYNLRIVVIPPNRDCIRQDLPDVVFTHKEAKEKALVEEIAGVHATGRPILVGTSSVAESEALASALKTAGVTCEVLNAKNDEEEAGIIAEAGALHAVTISTNMAGRGTDIILGGANQHTRDQVVELGGLYVMGTNRHESLRIDNQLRGRAGRQGDPGSSRFFVSLEDDLMTRYRVKELIPKALLPERQETGLDHPVIRREIARAQRIIESQNFEIRKTLWAYSELQERQRSMMHRYRMEILKGERFDSLVDRCSPERQEELRRRVDGVNLENAERRILLHHMDSYWSEHLARIADIREGIHLVRFSGGAPVNEFQRKASDLFLQVTEEINAAVVETLETIEINGNDIDTARAGLRGPSSTWTYLINDNPFSNFGFSLVASRNIGYAAYLPLVAVMNFPIALGILAWKRLSKLFKGRS